MAEYTTQAPDMFQENVTEGTPVIIDIGESACKVGFAGEEMPRASFPTIVGREKYTAVMVDAARKTAYVGEDANKSRGVLKIGYPISRGNIMNWEDYFELITHIYFNVLRVDSSKHPVIYIEHLLTPPETREYIARLFFDTYKVPAIFIVPSAVLAMFSVGLTNGFVIDSGEGCTFLVPIFGGEPFYPALTKLNLAGADVAESLKGLLLRRGYSLTSSASKEIAREIKEKNCYIAMDPDEERKNLNPDDLNSYDLPDGETIKIDPETRFYAAEILFNPGILGYNCESIPQAIINSLLKLDPYWQWELLKNLVLAGGNCNFKGFELRVERELGKLLSLLGPVPVSQPKTQEVKQDRVLVDVVGPEKTKDTCPNCGAEINPAEDKFCPSCSQKLEVTQISIAQVFGSAPGGGALTTCPKCNRDLPDLSEPSCPYCGYDFSLEPQKKSVQIGAINLSPPKEMRKEEEFSASEFDDVEEFKEAKVSTNIKFHAIDDRALSAFKGATILGSIGTFQQLLITAQEFRNNPASINKSISSLFGQ